MTTSKRNLMGWLFILPTVLLISVFLIYPTFWTIRLSFYGGLGFNPTKFVGLENYIRLFTQDPFFLKLDRFPPSGAVINNIIWVIFYTSLVIGFGLVIAVLADKVRYETVVKSIVFMPMAISYTAAGIIWLFIYSPNPRIGLPNAILTTLNPGFQAISWTGDVRFVNMALITAAVWMWTGFATVILSAALKGIPQELIEAARVDGATSWQVFVSIQVPLVGPTLSFLVITSIIGVIKLFDLVLVMGGGTGGPMGSARVIAFTQYIETFQSGRAGYGSAVAVFMLLVILPLMILNIRRFRAEETQQ